MRPKPIEPLLLKVEECISDRIDQMEILKNHKGFLEATRDQELRAQTRRNLRLIKQNEQLRIVEEDRALAQIPNLKFFSKENAILLERTCSQLMSRYLSVSIECARRGVWQDLVEVFQKYYLQINMISKAREMTVIRNLKIAEQVDFARQNLSIFLGHTRRSMETLLNKERVKFYNAVRQFPKDVRESPQRRQVMCVDIDEDKRPKKKQYYSYLHEISKILSLEPGTMANSAHFQKSEALQSERKVSILETTFLKKNTDIRDSIAFYSKQYTVRTVNRNA